MIYAKDNRIGLDAVIGQVQNKLMALATTWGVSLDGYPRCYPKMDKEKEDGGKKGIEHYVSNNQYSGNLIHAEGNKFFFTAENKPDRVGNGYYTTVISLYFVVDLTKCKPSITHRADEEVHADVSKVLRSLAGILEVDGPETDIEDVFRGYDYNIGDDLQPYHAFRFDLTVFEYKDNEQLCILN